MQQNGSVQINLILLGRPKPPHFSKKINTILAIKNYKYQIIWFFLLSLNH